jgi:hypothetical protein
LTGGIPDVSTKEQVVLTLSDDLVTLREAAKLLPRRRGGKRPHFSTLWRWALRGLRGIRLETVSVGDTLCTTPEALEEFMRRVSEARGLGTTSAPHVSRRRQREIAQAGDNLDRAGI